MFGHILYRCAFGAVQPKPQLGSLQQDFWHVTGSSMNSVCGFCTWVRAVEGHQFVCSNCRRQLAFGSLQHKQPVCADRTIAMGHFKQKIVCIGAGYVGGMLRRARRSCGR